MKKITSAVITFALSFSYCTAFANPFSTLPLKLHDIGYTEQESPPAEDSTVSISLSAGSTSMYLNGEELEITAPYVTDEGITLVPLRVITEAFGAEVIWNDAEQSVNIAYNEVTLSLVIGSKAAVINDHAEELESAPELKDGTTMVPLRFISETFGAEVEYDSESGVITVTLSDSEEAEMIRGMHDKEYIGDSYLGWSIKTPKGMSLGNRSSNGKSLSFNDEYSNYLRINVYESDEEIDAVAEFQSAVSSAYGVITVAEKGTDASGNPTFTIGVKDSYSTEIAKEIIKGNTIYTVTISTYSYDEEDADTKAAFDDLRLLMDTFSPTVKDDMYDFSDVKDGVREYENDDLKISLSIPEYFTESYASDAFNEILFTSDDNNMYGITLKVFSKSETASKDIFSKTQYSIDCSVFNPSIVSVEEPVTTTVSGAEATSYTLTCKTDDCEFVNRKAFFELGEYIYLISISDSDEEICQKVLDSIKAEELDTEETGTAISSATLMEGYTYKNDDFSFELPKYWSASYYYGFLDERTGSVIMDYSSYQLDEETLEAMIDDLKATEELVIIQPLKWHDTASGRYPEIKFKIVNEDAPDEYGGITGVVAGGDVVIYMYSYSELYHGSIIESEINDIIKSTKKIKK